MGVRSFCILLDSPTDTYYAGSNVTGRVCLNLDKKIKVRGLRIKFEGFAHVSWRKTVRRKDREGHSHHKTVTYSADEEYFSNRFYLIGSDNGDIEIPAGKNNYPFSMTLPQNLPTSFEGKRGHVRYTVKATLDTPLKLDQQVTILFQVHTPLDLNNHKTAKLPVKRETFKNFCCCWCKSGPLTLVVFVPHTGFVPDQEIPLTVEVDNASNVKVEAIKVTIKKIESYTARSPRLDTKSIHKELTKKTLGEVEINGSKTFSEAIKLTDVPFVNLKACSIINVDYFLKVEACVSGACSANLSEKIPLIIGTIPFNNTEGGTNFSSFDANSGAKSYSSVSPGLPPPFGFHPDGAFSPQNYTNPAPSQHISGFSVPYPASGFSVPYPASGFSVPYPPPVSDGPTATNSHSAAYPLPIYPDLKVNFSYPGGSVVDITASAPPLDSDSDGD
uniref:Arrestin C-terminal-like domain-containing protein n=1 Tax=Triatoma infestans TaxID=30076 RepID=A0A023EZ76_TRIIF